MAARKRVRGVTAFTGQVVHDVDRPNTHALASWALLSPLAATNIRRREVPDDYSQLPVWSCNLCTKFNRRPSKQAEITEHVRVVHEVRYITEGLHLISFLGPQRPYRRRVPLLAGRFPARYRCTHCAAASPQNVKLLPMRSLVPHLTDRHQVIAPTESDWVEIEPILRSC
ncbi:hypothetical protein C8R46DRAFT_1218983 [Mycena filopes]|nr:hypothetical protein C8R46DRAFT_1218983 [Mycena filopes]